MHGCLIVVVIIIISFISFKYGQSSQLDQLSGFWETPPEFNKESELSSCTMFISDAKNGEYTSYILMIDNEDDWLINEPCKFTLSESLCNMFLI